MINADALKSCAPSSDEMTPYEMVGEAGEQICAILKRGNLSYDHAPELYRALYLIDAVIKGYDGACAMVEKAETEAVVH